MKGRWFLVAVLLVASLAAGYMSWLTWSAGDDGKWMYVVLCLFFLVLASAPFWRTRAVAAQAESTAGTRFGPHWMMMIGLILFAIILVAAGWRLLRALF